MADEDYRAGVYGRASTAASGSPRGPATPAPSPAASAALEGWLAHTHAAAPQPAVPTAGAADPSYPPIDPLLHLTCSRGASTAQQTTSPGSASLPLAVLGSPRGAGVQPGLSVAGSPRGAAVQPGPSHPPRLAPVIPEDTSLAVEVRHSSRPDAQAVAWGHHTPGSARRSSREEEAMQARRLSWEQMIHERSHSGVPHSGVPSAAPAAIPAAVPGFQVKQQHAVGIDHPYIYISDI